MRLLAGICTTAMLILLSACGPAATDGSGNNSAGNAARPAAAANTAEPANSCGRQATYDSIRDAVFDNAIEQWGQDPVPLNDLKRVVTARMQYPIVVSVDDKLHRQDCRGRLILAIPPDAVNAFNGERELKADITYSVQPSADGNGDVVTADGIQFIVEKLVAAAAVRSTRNAEPTEVSDTPTSNGPSFSCGGRLARVEQMICQDRGLSNQDRQLASAFQARLDDLGDAGKAKLMTYERSRLAERSNCDDTQCIADWYDRMLEEYQ